MRVLHIIPATFHYFDDIQSAAFTLVSNLEKLGVETGVFTLQYGGEGGALATQSAVEKAATGRRYGGTLSINEALATFSEYDAVHVHAPFLGAAGKIMAAKQASGVPMLLTIYRPVFTPDFFSLAIKLYNWYYLPRLCALAETITVSSGQAIMARLPSIFRRFRDKMLEVDDTPNFVDPEVERMLADPELNAEERLAIKYQMVYNQFLP